MRNFVFILPILWILMSCSDSEEPRSENYPQVCSISDGGSNTRHINYDTYGRVINYEISAPDETISCSYSYPSGNRIIIQTKQITHLWDNDYVIREYDDELVLENGRVTICDGIFAMSELSEGEEKLLKPKKYRHEFVYSDDNYLNVVKCTEWNKQADEWAMDKPWTWENYYKWENGNLSQVEDFAGNKSPYYTYRYTYSAISGVQNILPIHFDRYQYYPLQLKGMFGAQSKNLITGIESQGIGGMSFEMTYEYDIMDGKISNYIETKNGVSDNYEVTWVHPYPTSE